MNLEKFKRNTFQSLILTIDLRRFFRTKYFKQSVILQFFQTVTKSEFNKLNCIPLLFYYCPQIIRKNIKFVPEKSSLIRCTFFSLTQELVCKQKF